MPTTTTRPRGLDTVRAALAALMREAAVEPPEATAKQVAARAGLAYSTTAAKLRALEQAGHAVRRSTGIGEPDLWRLTDTGHDTHDPDSLPSVPTRLPEASEPASDATPPAAVASRPEDLTDRDSPTDQTTGTTDESSEAAENSGPDDAQPDHTEQDQGPEPPAKTRPSEPAEDTNPDRLDDGDPAQNSGAQNDGEVTAEVSPEPPEAPTDTSPPSGQTASAVQDLTGGAPQRRPKGTLRGATLDILEANPQTAYTVRDLCRLIDKANEGTGAAKASNGAVANVLYKLVATGEALLVQDRPATFQLASASASD